MASKELGIIIILSVCSCAVYVCVCLGPLLVVLMV